MREMRFHMIDSGQAENLQRTNIKRLKQARFFELLRWQGQCLGATLQCGRQKVVFLTDFDHNFYI